MKAIRIHQFGGPEVLKLEETANPQAGPNQIVIAIHAAGVNPVDTYIRNGTYAFKPPLPYTPGTDAAGVVESIGAGITTFKPGDRVWVGGAASIAAGTYAEQVLCNANQVYRLADSVTFAQGAAVNVPYVTAYHAMFQVANTKPGETMLVHGATGGVGIACVQLAVARGITLIGTGGSEKGRALVMNQGAAHVLDHTKPDYLAELMKLTDGRGFDVICEMVANVNLGKDLPLLAKHGRVVVIGSRGPIEINPRDIMGRHGQILGVSPGTEEDRKESTAAITAGLFNGTLRPIVDVEFPLADAAKAHEDVMGGGSHGKIVLMP